MHLNCSWTYEDIIQFSQTILWRSQVTASQWRGVALFFKTKSWKISTPKYQNHPCAISHKIKLRFCIFICENFQLDLYSQSLLSQDRLAEICTVWFLLIHTPHVLAAKEPGIFYKVKVQTISGNNLSSGHYVHGITQEPTFHSQDMETLAL